MVTAGSPNSSGSILSKVISLLSGSPGEQAIHTWAGSPSPLFWFGIYNVNEVMVVNRLNI